ncbi:MAG: hypothetical protein HKN82_11025 [Akkermansiaceae bacterium]|nr:hypothetical protein [Akkermansiaceae bacterium]
MPACGSQEAFEATRPAGGDRYADTNLQSGGWTIPGGIRTGTAIEALFVIVEVTQTP